MQMLKLYRVPLIILILFWGLLIIGSSANAEVYTEYPNTVKKLTPGQVENIDNMIAENGFTDAKFLYVPHQKRFVLVFSKDDRLLFKAGTMSNDDPQWSLTYTENGSPAYRSYTNASSDSLSTISAPNENGGFTFAWNHMDYGGYGNYDFRKSDEVEIIDYMVDGVILGSEPVEPEPPIDEDDDDSPSNPPGGDGGSDGGGDTDDDSNGPAPDINCTHLSAEGKALLPIDYGCVQFSETKPANYNDLDELMTKAAYVEHIGRGQTHDIYVMRFSPSADYYPYEGEVNEKNVRYVVSNYPIRAFVREDTNAWSFHMAEDLYLNHYKNESWWSGMTWRQRDWYLGVYSYNETTNKFEFEYKGSKISSPEGFSEWNTFHYLNRGSEHSDFGTFGISGMYYDSDRNSYNADLETYEGYMKQFYQLEMVSVNGLYFHYHEQDDEDDMNEDWQDDFPSYEDWKNSDDSYWTSEPDWSKCKGFDLGCYIATAFQYIPWTFNKMFVPDMTSIGGRIDTFLDEIMLKTGSDTYSGNLESLKLVEPKKRIVVPLEIKTKQIDISMPDFINFDAFEKIKPQFHNYLRGFVYFFLLLGTMKNLAMLFGRFNSSSNAGVFDGAIGAYNERKERTLRNKDTSDYNARIDSFKNRRR